MDTVSHTIFVTAQHSRGTPPNNDTQKENDSVGRRSFLKITTHIYVESLWIKFCEPNVRL